MSKPRNFLPKASVLVLVVLVLLCLPASAAMEAESRVFLLKDQSSLRFDVPKTWRSESKPTEKPLGVQITIDAPSKAPILIQMMGFQPRTRRETASDLKSIRTLVKGVAQQLKNKVVETEIPVRRLNGPHAAGYYISVTDKFPKPGAHKFTAQGLVRIGPLHMTFTILTDDATGKIIPAAIAMVRTGAFNQAAAKQARKPKPISKAHSILVSKREKEFHLTVPVSRLAMTIPRNNLTQNEKGRRTGSTSARYFHLRDADRQLIISGWFEAAQDYRGSKLLWMKEAAQMRRKGGSKPKDVRFEKFGQWKVVRYETDTLMGKKLPRAIPNLRAHWVEAGTWIELHLSIAADLPPEEAKRQLTEALKSITITRKN